MYSEPESITYSTVQYNTVQYSAVDAQTHLLACDMHVHALRWNVRSHVQADWMQITNYCITSALIARHVVKYHAGVKYVHTCTCTPIPKIVTAL